MRRLSIIRRDSRPIRATRKFAKGPGALAGVLGALAASEAMARERIGNEPLDSPEDAPAATSLEDILGFARICRTRGAFAAFDAEHRHDPFTPQFIREGAASRFTHDDHAAHAEQSGAHRQAVGEHESHSQSHEVEGVSAAGLVSPEAHDAHELVEAPCEEMQGLPALSPEHAGHLTELVMSAGDLDESLAALLRAADEAHQVAHDVELAAPDSEAESDIPEQEAEATAPAPLAEAPVHHHHHDADAIVVTAEI